MKSCEFEISEEVKSLLFSEISRIRQQHPSECLAQDQLWSDTREKGNGITRDRSTNTLCYTVGVFGESGDTEESYSLRENSEVLLGSALFQTITELVRPYELP
ncbi:MAG: hypothetical protein JWQ07_4212 [Ramlibacter sp.]|nr:hypothetical protein [Ramlibacter sp.]